MSLSVHIRHAFPGFELDVGFEAPSGLTVLFGASGAGKSTVVKAMAGLLSPDQARITLNDTHMTYTAQGIDWPPEARRVGYVFQEPRLFPHMSVARNLTYGMSRAHKPQFAKVVEMLDLGPLMGRRPARLSGGEQQRVALGRALLSDPQLLLADEPLSALDDRRKAEILPYFERLRDAGEVPIIYVTHSVQEASRLATQVVVLSKGKVTHIGPPEEVLSDPDVTPLGIRDVGAIIEAEVGAPQSDGLTALRAGSQVLYVPGQLSPEGAKVRLRIAAQDVFLARSRPDDISALNILPATIDHVRLGEGPGALVTLNSAAGPILSRVTRRSVERMGLAAGQSCYAILKTVAIAPGDLGLSDGVDAKDDVDP